MVASAAKICDAEQIICSGLSQIPCTSRLFEEIMHVVEMYKNNETKNKVFEYIHSKYNEGGSYGWCHTISNAMIVAASLLFEEGDFGKPVCMAVETGFDTVCNGATVGSIIGMANGIESVNKKWSAPFNDILETTIFGVGNVKISECAEKTVKHIEKAYKF